MSYASFSVSRAIPPVGVPDHLRLAASVTIRVGADPSEYLTGTLLQYMDVKTIFATYLSQHPDVKTLIISGPIEQLQIPKIQDALEGRFRSPDLTIQCVYKRALRRITNCPPRSAVLKPKPRYL